jgi:hypothetical protein
VATLARTVATSRAGFWRVAARSFVVVFIAEFGDLTQLATALKRENPERTAAQVQRILRATSGWAPSDRTLQRLFGRLELNRPADGDGQQRVFGRFEASRPNEPSSLAIEVMEWPGLGSRSRAARMILGVMTVGGRRCGRGPGRRPCLPRPHAGHAGRTVPAPRRPARL